MAFCVPRFLIAPRVAGVLAAVLALVSQLAIGAMVLPDRAPAATAVASIAVLCVGATAPAHGPTLPAPAHRPHTGGGVGLCPLGVALDLPAVVPTGDVVVPMPRLGVARGPLVTPTVVVLQPPARRAWTPRGPPLQA